MAILEELKARLAAVVNDYKAFTKKLDDVIIGNDKKEVKILFDENGNLDLSQADNLGEREKEALITPSKSPVGKEPLSYMIKTESKITIKSYPYIALQSKGSEYITVAGWHVITSVSAMAGGKPITLKKGDSKGEAKSCTIHLFEGTLKYKMLQKSDPKKQKNF